MPRLVTLLDGIGPNSFIPAGSVSCFDCANLLLALRLVFHYGTLLFGIAPLMKFWLIVGIDLSRMHYA